MKMKRQDAKNLWDTANVMLRCKFIAVNTHFLKDGFQISKPNFQLKKIKRPD